MLRAVGKVSYRVGGWCEGVRVAVLNRVVREGVTETTGEQRAEKVGRGIWEHSRQKEQQVQRP